jgi:hypothetical protein
VESRHASIIGAVEGSLSLEKTFDSPKSASLGRADQRGLAISTYCLNIGSVM